MLHDPGGWAETRVTEGFCNGHMLDADLLTSYLVGDKEAYAVLLARYHGLVRTACIRQAPPGEVEDCIQAVFLVLLCRPAAAARAPVLAAWLMRVTWYVCRAAQRATKCRRTAERQAAALTITPDITPPEALEHLDDCLARIPEQQRAAISLQYLAGKNPDEVARELGVTRDNAYQLVSRGLVALRALLARRGIAVTGAALLTVLATEGKAAAASPATSLTLSFTTRPTREASALAHGASTAMTITAITPITLAAAALLLSVVAVGVVLASEVSPVPLPVPVPVPVVPVSAQVDTPTAQAVARIDLTRIDQCPGLADRLAQRVTVDFKEVAMTDVLEFLRQNTATNVLETPAFRKRSSTIKGVTLKAQNMRFDTLVESVCTLTDTTVSAQSQGLVFDVVPEAGLIPTPVVPAPTTPTRAF